MPSNHRYSGWSCPIRVSTFRPQDEPFCFKNTATCVGHIDEWHLDFGNTFRHIAFDCAAALSASRSDCVAPGSREVRSIGSVSDSMCGDGIK